MYNPRSIANQSKPPSTTVFIQDPLDPAKMRRPVVILDPTLAMPPVIFDPTLALRPTSRNSPLIDWYMLFSFGLPPRDWR